MILKTVCQYDLLSLAAHERSLHIYRAEPALAPRASPGLAGFSFRGWSARVHHIQGGAGLVRPDYVSIPLQNHRYTYKQDVAH